MQKPQFGKGICGNIRKLYIASFPDALLLYSLYANEKNDEREELLLKLYRRVYA